MEKGHFMSTQSKLSVIIDSGASARKSRARRFRKKTYRLRELAGDVASLVPRGPDLFGIWVTKRLEPRFREEIMVAVSRTNECKYCNYMHTWWASRVGLSEGELEKIKVWDPQSPDTRDRIAIAYVQELVRRDFKPVAKDLVDLLSEQYSRRECADIETVARVMTVFNRSANTFDALVSRLKGEASDHSRVPDELVIGFAFVLVAPVMTAALSLLQQRSPLAVIRDFRAFSRKFEEDLAVSNKPRLRSVESDRKKGRQSA